MTHVFIVNDQTFKIHLEYLFAGTGCKKDALFLGDSEYVNPRRNTEGITSTAERNIVSMIADVSRIRPGDNIIFYLQANASHQGMFFGVFKAVSKSFYCPSTETGLNTLLGKELIFRVLIEPSEVYANGISEHDALDNLEGIKHPSEMCWSLIYRKLKGNRGCTMITDYESDSLIKKIKTANNGQTIKGNGFSFDITSSIIIDSDKRYVYTEKQNNLSITERLLFKANRNNAYEVHLQAFIMQNFDKSPLKDFLNNNPYKPFWIGNEVSCGVGMQRIDIMTMQEDEDNLYINIAELKYTEPYKEIVTIQLPWYINWVINYIAPLYPNKQIKIVPLIIAKEIHNLRELEIFKNDCLLLKPSRKSNIEVFPVKYIGFSADEDLSFEKIL